MKVIVDVLILDVKPAISCVSNRTVVFAAEDVMLVVEGIMSAMKKDEGSCKSESTSCQLYQQREYRV